MCQQACRVLKRVRLDVDTILVESTRPRVVVETLMRVRHGGDVAVGVGPFVGSQNLVRNTPMWVVRSGSQFF